MTAGISPPFEFKVNAGIALLAAAFWGGADFAGGMGVKVAGAGLLSSLRVILVSHGASLLVLLLTCSLNGESLPHGRPAFYALLGGAIAGLAIAAFYVALAQGLMGAPAALSGLLAAAIPAVVSSAIEGRPGRGEVVGFVLAGLAIWLIASVPESAHGPGSAHDRPERTPATRLDRHRGFGLLLSPLWLATLGGVGFGVYFLLLRLANPLGVLLPITLARVGSFTTCALLLAVATVSSPSREASGGRMQAAAGWEGFGRSALLWSLGIAFLDTGGNLLFVAATRMGRLDVASVLASLYPAGTILLAAFYLHERPARQQLAGMGLALLSVVLVAG